MLGQELGARFTGDNVSALRDCFRFLGLPTSARPAQTGLFRVSRVVRTIRDEYLSLQCPGVQRPSLSSVDDVESLSPVGAADTSV